MRTAKTFKAILLAATLTLLGDLGGAPPALAQENGGVVSVQTRDGAAAHDVLKTVFASATPLSMGVTLPAFRLEGDAANARIGNLRATDQPLATVVRLVCRAATPRLAFTVESDVYVFRVADGAESGAQIEPITVTPAAPVLPRDVASAPYSDNLIIARDGDTGLYETILLLYADVVDLATVLPIRVLPIGSRAGGMVPSGIGLWGFGPSPAPAGGGTPGANGSPPLGAGGGPPSPLLISR